MKGRLAGGGDESVMKTPDKVLEDKLPDLALCQVGRAYVNMELMVEARDDAGGFLEPIAR